MGKNTGNGTRIGRIKGRGQIYNPLTKKYIKVNTETGRFMSSSNTKYKNVKMVNRNSPQIKKSNVKRTIGGKRVTVTRRQTSSTKKDKPKRRIIKK